MPVHDLYQSAVSILAVVCDMDGFSLYIDRLQILGFFSGYLLLYALIISVFAGKKRSNLYFNRNAIPLLPYSYALCGLLYAGLLLRDFTAAYKSDPSSAAIDFSFGTALALLSILFFIPFFSRKPLYSILHCVLLVGYTLSLILIQQSLQGTGNLMKVYTTSILINAGCYALVILIAFLHTKFSPRTSGPMAD